MAQDGSGACCGSGLQRMFVATWQVQMQMVQLCLLGNAPEK